MLINIHVYGLCQKECCFGINECAVFGLKYSQPKNSCYYILKNIYFAFLKCNFLAHYSPSCSLKIINKMCKMDAKGTVIIVI